MPKGGNFLDNDLGTPVPPPFILLRIKNGESVKVNFYYFISFRNVYIFNQMKIPYWTLMQWNVGL